MHRLSADASTLWLDFTEQHEHVRRQASAVALGEDANHTAAIVGVYGSGKSTLLLHLLRAAPELGVVAVWDEAAAFLDRIVPPGTRVRAHEFVRRVHAWTAGLRDPAGLQTHAAQLTARGRGDVAELTRPQRPAGERRLILLIDEMEQAHGLFTERIQADDGNPLRSLTDACGPQLGLLIGYAPESFQALGVADRGRHRVLRIPALRASTIARHYGLPRGVANFAWWVSRGRARGVIQAIDTIVRPQLAGAFRSEPAAIADAIDLLPPIFGVPALVRDRVPVTRLADLVDLAPVAHTRGGVTGLRFDLRDEAGLLAELEAALMTHLPADARLSVQSVVRELVVVLDACADDDDQAWIPHDQLDALWRLALARAQEAGKAGDLGDEWRSVALFALHARGTTALARELPIPLPRLIEELFPSPFGDPLLPIAGRHPTRLEVDREYGALSGGDPEPLLWPARRVVFLRDEAALERWLAATDLSDEPWIAALLQPSDKPRGPRTLLLEEAGKLARIGLSPFSADFVRSILVSAAVAGLRGDLDELAERLSTTKDIRRKVRWHLERLAVIVRDARPQESPAFEAATAELGVRLLPFLRQRRLAADSPATLALVPLAHAVSPATRAQLTELADLLRPGRPLRGLATGPRLHGAAVVVDELLPDRTATRWVWDETTPALRALLVRHTVDATYPALARLLAPDQAAALTTLLVADSPEPADPDREAGQAALARLVRLVDGALDVHAGVAALIGCPPDHVPRDLSLGAALDALVQARLDLSRLRSLVADDAPPDPWAQALTRWLVGRFAEAAQDGLVADEVDLREWQLRAAEARALGLEADALLARLRARELAGLAAALERRRAHLRAHLAAPDALRQELARLRERVEALARLHDVLAAFADDLARRGVACQELLRRYDPQDHELRDDLALLRDALDLLRRVDGRPPPPTGTSLRAWARRLVEFLAQGRLERLRLRLDAALALPLDLTRVEPLYEEDVAVLEDIWPKIDRAFRTAIADELAARPPAGSTELSRLAREALDKQALLRRLDPQPWASDLDRALARLAAGPRCPVAQVREQLELRGALREALANHGDRSAPRSVLQAVLKDRDDFEDARRALAAFLERAERSLVRLRELELDPALPADAAPDAWLGALEAAVVAGEREHQRQTHRFELLAVVQRRLGLRVQAIGWARSVKIVAARVTDADALLRGLLAQRGEAEHARAARLGVAPPALDDADPGRWLDALEALERDLDRVEQLRSRLSSRTGKPWHAAPAPLSDVLTHLHEALRDADHELARLRAALDRLVWQARALGLAELPLPPDDHLDVLAEALARGKERLREARDAKIRDLGPEAQAAWQRLQSGHGIPRGCKELLDAGLLMAVGKDLE